MKAKKFKPKVIKRTLAHRMQQLEARQDDQTRARDQILTRLSARLHKVEQVVTSLKQFQDSGIAPGTPDDIRTMIEMRKLLAGMLCKRGYPGYVTS